MAAGQDLSLKAADGTRLALTDWLLPPGAALGGVVLMHGLGEHSGRYAHVAQFFNHHGWSVRAYDHRGHGRSGGARGDVPDDQTMLQDARLVIEDFAARTGTAPLLFGHSMGGLFAARYATGNLSPLRGLILSSPALAVPLSGAQKILLKILTAVAPGLGIPNGVKSEFLSHDPAVAKAYTSDALVHAKISARLLHSMLASIAFAQANAGSLRLPTLMVVAGDDRLVDASGSKAFFEQITAGVGRLHWYADLYHELWNEVDQQKVFGDLAAWLAAHGWSKTQSAA